MEYHPPLADIRFLLEEVLGLDAMAAQIPAFAEADAETMMALLEESARFHTEVVAPLDRLGDLEGSVRNDDGSVTTPKGFANAYAQYVAAGWGGIQFDPEYGGGGLPRLIGLAGQEITTSACLSFSLCPLLTQGAIEAVSLHGSPEQKATYLEHMITGRWSGTMNLTEPHAGSDVGALTTKAEPVGDGSYRITGTKIFITWGEHDMAENIVHLVLARAPGAPPGTKGISLFLVPKYLVEPDGSLGARNDVRCVSIEHKMGIHASPTAVLSYGENEGAIGYLVGEEHQGMHYMFTMMNTARLAVGLEGLAVAERAYQRAAAFARERLQGRALGTPPGTQSPIVDHPDVRRMLMTMRSGIEAMRAVMYLNAQAIDLASAAETVGREASDELAQILIPISKGWGTDFGMELVSLAVQVHGGMGYIEETGVAQHYRDLRIAPIYEGTNGIQAIDLVGRKLDLRGGEAMRSFLAAMADTATEAVGAGDPALKTLGQQLQSGVDEASRATEHLLGAEPVDRLAAASPYLMMMGYVSGGWMMLRSAIAAHPHTGDGGFHDRKMATAEFYLTQLLPRVHGLLGPVIADGEQLMRIPADGF